MFSHWVKASLKSLVALMMDNTFLRICTGVYGTPEYTACFLSYSSGLVKRIIGLEGNYVMDITSTSFCATSLDDT